MQKILNRRNGFIFASILVSFLLVKTLSNTVFLAGTPRLNPEFIANLQNAPSYIAHLPQTMFSKQKSTSQIALTPNYTPLSQGVYAKEVNNVSYTSYHLDEMQWVNMTIQKNDGTTMTITYPKGNPPSEELINYYKSH